MLKKFLSLGVLFCFLLTSVIGPNTARAQALTLPAPGTMLMTTPDYAPAMIKGLQVHPENPLLFDFIVDSGKSGFKIDSAEFKAESQKLIKYFLASLTIKEDDLWVNLSPYEKDRMLTHQLGQTELGRDMLAQDYILKQLTSSLLYPEKGLGKAFWARVYAKAQAQFGTTEVPVDTFNKVWIVADKAKVVERNNAAYVVGAHLKVMLETDYLAMSNVKMTQVDSSSETVKAIARDIIIPEIEKEVNQGQNFAPLRQMFYSMILASWYKRALKNAFLNQVYSNKGKTGGVLSDDPAVKEKIYAQYLAAYQKGVFNYIKEETDPATGTTIPRKYFSGGAVFPVLKDVQVASAPGAGDVTDADGDLGRVTANVSPAESVDGREPVAEWVKKNNAVFKDPIKAASGKKEVEVFLQFEVDTMDRVSFKAPVIKMTGENRESWTVRIFIYEFEKGLGTMDFLHNVTEAVVQSLNQLDSAVAREVAANALYHIDNSQAIPVVIISEESQIKGVGLGGEKHQYPVAIDVLIAGRTRFQFKALGINFASKPATVAFFLENSPEDDPVLTLAVERSPSASNVPDWEIVPGQEALIRDYLMSRMLMNPMGTIEVSNDVVAAVQGEQAPGGQLLVGGQKVAGGFGILGSGNNFGAADENGKAIHPDVIKEGGHALVWREATQTWEWLGPMLKGRKLTAQERSPGDRTFEESFSGLNIARRLTRWPHAEERLARFMPGQDIKAVFALIREQVPDTDLQRRALQKAAERALIAARDEALSKNDQVIWAFVADVGYLIGVALASLLKEYAKESWVEHFVLGSGIGENFGKPSDGRDDIFLIRIRDGVRAQLYKTTVLPGRTDVITRGIVRSTISWEREFRAATLTEAQAQEARKFLKPEQEPYSVGVSLGGNNLRVAILRVDGTFKAISREKKWTSTTPEGLVQEIRDLIRELFAAQLDIAPEQIVRIKVAVPGPVNPETGYVGTEFPLPNIPFLDNYPLAAEVRAVLLEDHAMKPDGKAGTLVHAVVPRNGLTLTLPSRRNSLEFVVRTNGGTGRPVTFRASKVSGNWEVQRGNGVFRPVRRGRNIRTAVDKDIVEISFREGARSREVILIAGKTSMTVTVDAAAKTAVDAGESVALNGGIDLNAKNMDMAVSSNGQGVQMNIDPAMVQRFTAVDFSGVVPVILRVTPIASLFN